jgi:modulator of FtsH protease
VSLPWALRISVITSGPPAKIDPTAAMGSAYNPSAWSTFFSTEAGASAALTGLIFVAVSINLSRIIKIPQLVARSAKALIGLTGVLIASTLCMAPAQPAAALGCELTLLGIFVWLTTTRFQHQSSYKNPYIHLKERILQNVLTQLSALPLIAGGASLIAGFGGGSLLARRRNRLFLPHRALRRVGPAHRDSALRDSFQKSPLLISAGHGPCVRNCSFSPARR